MKKSTVIVLSVLFVGIIIAAALLFPKLRDSYSKSTASQTTSSTDAGSKTQSLEQATDFTVYDQDGKAVKLSDFIGKPTVVNFWATWCGYCVEELPDFDTLYDEYKNQVNFVMLNLTDGVSETTSSALAFINQEGYSFPVYYDTALDAATAYSITGIPMTLFIDQDGGLYKIYNGMIDKNTLCNYIEALVSE